MGGVFSFIGGLLSLGASAGMSLKDQNDLDIKNQEYINGNYSYFYQSEYDYNYGKLMAAYDFELIEDAICNDYPNITSYNATQIAATAVAKRMMEEETKYKYKVPSKFSYFDLDKYAADEFKR